MNPYRETQLLLPDLDLVEVQGGAFRMGTPEEDSDSYSDERPDHTVTVPSFYMAKFPVTQRLWEAVTGENPSEFQGEKRPVETVSWKDAQAFIQKLNELTGERFRLPSEAEWEFAARGGIHRSDFKYVGSNKLKEVGWYDENSHEETKPVGLKFPNELGLYDMSGNVWEWCEDVWHDNYEGALGDGNAWLKSGDENIRVVRGGSWYYSSKFCRVAYCIGGDGDDRYDDIGFRLAR